MEDPVQTTEPLPPGIADVDIAPVALDDTTNCVDQPIDTTIIGHLDDPGTPLESETQEHADVTNGIEAVPAEMTSADVDYAQEDDDDDDDIEITIGDIKNNVTLRPGQGGRTGGAVGAKPTSKLDIDQTAMLNGAPVFDVDLNSLEEKPWRKPGADITDYFNYGFTEETWMIYCERQKKLRTEFGSAVQANKVYFSQPPNIIGGGQPSVPPIHQQTPMPVPTLENRKTVAHSSLPPQVINLVPPSMKQIAPVTVVNLTAPPPQTKLATVLTPSVPAPAEHVPSTFDSSVAIYDDSDPGSPGTPPAQVGSEHEDSNHPITPRSSAPQQSIPSSVMTSVPPPTSGPPDLSKITSTLPPSSANFAVPNLSVPPPRLLPPTNIPPPGVRPPYGPPPIFTSMPPPGFGNPPTNLPPPGFGNPPPPGMPPQNFAPGPFGFPPPMRPQMQPPRFGPPPGSFGGFDQPPGLSRAEAHSPASYSDRSSDSDGRGDRYESRFGPGMGGGPPGTRPRVEHRRSRSPRPAGRSSKHSHGHSSSRHRSRSPVDRDSDRDRERDRDRDRGSRRGRDDDDGSKKKRSRRDEGSDKKKPSSKSSRGDDGHSSSKKRKRSKERKGDEKSSRH